MSQNSGPPPPQSTPFRPVMDENYKPGTPDLYSTKHHGMKTQSTFKMFPHAQGVTHGTPLRPPLRAQVPSTPGPVDLKMSVDRSSPVPTLNDTAEMDDDDKLSELGEIMQRKGKELSAAKIQLNQEVG